MQITKKQIEELLDLICRARIVYMGKNNKTEFKYSIETSYLPEKVEIRDESSS